MNKPKTTEDMLEAYAATLTEPERAGLQHSLATQSQRLWPLLLVPLAAAAMLLILFLPRPAVSPVKAPLASSFAATGQVSDAVLAINQAATEEQQVTEEDSAPVETAGFDSNDGLAPDSTFTDSF